MLPILELLVALQAHAPDGGWRSRTDVFTEIFLVFLVLGTLVGIVVMAYMMYNAYKYRDGAHRRGEEFDRPQVGELPTGEGGGKKLFVSFGISAIIVISLIGWTYGTLLYVEAGPDVDDQAEGEHLEVEVIGQQFSWEFVYPNGHSERDHLIVPEDTVVELHVTSDDVWHTFGAPELRVKADAIPGQVDETWFIAEETGEYEAWCYELCGVGHSRMTADVTVASQEEFDEWYAQTEAEGENGENNETDNGDGENGGTDQ